MAIRLFVLFFISSIAYAQTELKEKIIRGNENYENKTFDKAEAEYKAALSQDDKSVKAQYNLGNSLYQQERYDEAITHYEKVKENANDKITKGKAAHNLGNTYLEQKEYQKALDAYKEALKNNPNDASRYNYSYAKKMLQKQQEQKNKEEQKNEQKDKQDKNESEEDKESDKNDEKSGESDKKQKDQNKPDENSKGSNDGDEKPDENKEKPQPNKNEKTVPAETRFKQKLAERKLDDLAEQEKQTQKKLIRRKAKQNISRSEKDW